MNTHELFGVLGAIVTGAIILGALQSGSAGATVLSAGASGFSSILSAMKAPGQQIGSTG